MDAFFAERMQEVSTTIAAIKGEPYARLTSLFACIVWNIHTLHKMTHEEVPEGAICFLFERLAAQLAEFAECAGVQQGDVVTMLKAVMSDTEAGSQPRDPA